MSKVLVLGAGASHAYGYPLGGELRQRILAIQPGEAISSGIISIAESQEPHIILDDFQNTFRESMFYSIDAFLARRSEFSEIGKRCIAHILLSCEKRELLFSESPGKDHWYQYLLNRYLKVDWDDLDFSDLSIITFNYDRSFEQFMLGALQAAYGKSSEQTVEKLKTLRIIHVYGTLGSTYPGKHSPYRNYGETSSQPQWTYRAAKSIRVIPESRNTNSLELLDARDTLAKADGICFLGFGFDEINVERLAEGEACGAWKLRNKGLVKREITGTCIGMTDREANSAWRKLTVTSSESLSFPLAEKSLQHKNCTQLLRETLFLG